MEKAYLVLQDGTVFEGKRFGAPVDARGEVVFTTAMTGYLETLTDPRYHGQLVVQTFPMMGDYGLIHEEFTSNRSHLGGYIVREVCSAPSNFRSEGAVEAWMQAQGVPGICGIDTRALTRRIRTSGVLNAALLSALPADLDAFCKTLAAMEPPRAVPSVEAAVCGCPAEHPVVLLDFGATRNLLQGLEAEDISVQVVPWPCTAQDILALNPSGLLLSNGPGDPAANPALVEQVRLLMEAKLPTLGIGLGHQLMALAMGARAAKLKFGHRGDNQPANNLETGTHRITSQNHGHAIVAQSLLPCVRPLYVNANDGTIEGLRYTDRPAFSVQFNPPVDDALYGEFARLCQIPHEGGTEECR